MHQVECPGGHPQDVSWMAVWKEMSTASCVIFLTALSLWGVELLRNHVPEPFCDSCPTLCDPMDCSTPGFPVLQYLLEFAQTHIHWVSDAIQPSHPLASPLKPFYTWPSPPRVELTTFPYTADSNAILHIHCGTWFTCLSFPSRLRVPLEEAHFIRLCVCGPFDSK